MCQAHLALIGSSDRIVVRFLGMGRARLWIVGVTALFVVTLFLPWFREVGRDDATTTFNAFEAGIGWVLAILAMVAGFVALALYGLTRDVRAMPYAGACSLAAGLIVLARCWTSLDAATEGGSIDRRWGLFVTLNVIPLFGIALREAGTALMRQMLPPVTERDYGYGI
jgi:hypothetical protein